MSEPYIGEIKAVAYNFAPKFWSACNGQVMPINSNQALYSLLGLQFGGNGQTNFNLPDLRGRTPVGIGSSPILGISYTQGQQGGLEAVSLNLTQIPPHTHIFHASADAATAINPILAPSTLATASNDYYNNVAPDVALISGSVATVGSSQPHNNLQPSLALMYIIALSGIYPSRN